MKSNKNLLTFNPLLTAQIIFLRGRKDFGDLCYPLGLGNLCLPGLFNVYGNWSCMLAWFIQPIRDNYNGLLNAHYN